MTKLLLSLVCCLTIWTAARADEMQVPVDSAGTVPYIDVRLRDKLRLFPEIANFQEARLYQKPDSSFVLEISYQKGPQRLRERREMTAQEAQEFRNSITRGMVLHDVRGVLDQEGRARLLAGTTLMGLGFWGWAFPAAMNADGVGAGSLYLLISGSSFLVPFLMTKECSVTDGDASLAMYGATRGLLYGAEIYTLTEPREGDADGRTALALMAFTSIGGTYAGYKIADGYDLSWGSAAMINTGGDLGFAWGVGITDLVQDNSHASATAGAALVGSATGLTVGALLADHHNYTRGDVSAIKSLIVLTTVAPITLVSYADPENGNPYIIAGLAGSAAGVLLGHRMIRDLDFSRSQGILISLSEFSGILFGVGLTYAIASDHENGSTYLTTGTLGGAAGFALAYRAFSKDARARAGWSKLDLSTEPTLLSAYRSNPGGEPRQVPVPGLKLTLKF